MKKHECDLCRQEALFVDVAVPDAAIPGANANECGYRAELLCTRHAAERWRVNTSRIYPLNAYAAEIFTVVVVCL